jgi:phospholipid/cholesterol/gamma-HCH transport system permease protein
MMACVYGGYSTMNAFIEGIQTDFTPFHMTYAFIKSFVFAFILATVPSFHGYYMKGGALEVGKASTKSFIWTSVSIVVFNFLITQMLLG